ncbi:MAG TPA: hypothetical protein VGV59_02675 [Pyrinomonadaceae bacterium]|nr:hypothetical protein [Pyrinomonadaceae bacterium]
MGEISKWLMHDDQKELFEILFAVTLNLVFVALIALLLWPLGNALLALRLSKGYIVLWLVMLMLAGSVYRVQEYFRVDMYEHANAFLFSNLAVSCLLQTGWTAFTAQTVQVFTAGASIWMMSVLYFIGFLSCLVAYYVVASFYQGSFYRLTSLPINVLSYIVFCVWPMAGRVLYGWFFEMF